MYGSESLALDGGMVSSLLVIGGQLTVQTQCTDRQMDAVESSLDSVKQYTRSSAENKGEGDRNGSEEGGEGISSSEPII